MSFLQNMSPQLKVNNVLLTMLTIDNKTEERATPSVCTLEIKGRHKYSCYFQERSFFF